MTKILHFKRR